MSHVTQTSVVALDGQDVDDAFADSEPHIKRIVVEVLGRRRYPESVPIRVFAVDVSNITIRKADIRQRPSTSTRLLRCCNACSYLGTGKTARLM